MRHNDRCNDFPSDELRWPAWRGETLYILVSVQVSIAFTVLNGALSVRMTKGQRKGEKEKEKACARV